MNWGIKIVIGMAIAMTAVVCTGIYMVNKDTDTLEEINYYEKGLNYDEEYQKKENVALHHNKAQVFKQNDSLVINFSKAYNSVVVNFKRPSDESLDRKLSFSTIKSYKIPIKDMKKGTWHIRLEWENEGVNYLQDENIYIN